VPFFAVITSRYRKFMGSISERIISGSNSNSPNNTGRNRLNTNISVTVTTRRSTWQDTPVIALPPWLPGGVPRPCNLSLLPHCSSSSCSSSPTEILEYHSAAGAAQGTWSRGWKRVLLAADLARSGSGNGKIWRKLFSCWRSWDGNHWSCGCCSRTREIEAALSILLIPAAQREMEK
jgi:hypothetical protein